MVKDFNGKYSGEQVEQLLDRVASGGGMVYVLDLGISNFDSVVGSISGSITQDVVESLKQTPTIILKLPLSEGIGYFVCECKQLMDNGVILLFNQFNDYELLQLVFHVSGTNYVLAKTSTLLVTEFDLETKYTKPEYGIPKTDLDQEVNDILHAVEVTDLPELKASVDGLVEITNDTNIDISNLYDLIGDVNGVLEAIING